MSDGWSTARYSRANANRRMTPPTPPFANWRGRPGTTSPYAMAMRIREKTATGGEGIENPPQRPMISTP